MKKTVFVFIFLVLLIGIGVSDSNAKVYSWVVEEGVRHFSNVQPTTNMEKVKTEEEVVAGSGTSSSESSKTRSRYSNYKPFKMPVNGQCDEFYLLIEGVCVFPEAGDSDPQAMMRKISEFKKTGKQPKMTTASAPKASGEDSQCRRAKDKLERYLRDGVMGINPLTGKMKKMTGQAAQDAIQSAKDDVAIFCEN